MTVVMERGLFELIENLAPGKVYALQAPQHETGPFLVYQNPSKDRWKSFDGSANVAQKKIQIDAYAQSYWAAKTLAQQVEDTIVDYSGVVYYGTSSPQDSVRINGVTLEDSEDLLDKTDEPFLYRVRMSYLVTYYTS